MFFFLFSVFPDASRDWFIPNKKPAIVLAIAGFSEIFVIV